MSVDSAIADLEAELAAAQDRLERAFEALGPKHKGGEIEEAQAASQNLLEVKRRLAAAQGHPYAVPAEFPLRWRTGAPLPHLIRNDNCTVLLFHLAEAPDPEWDRTTINIVDSHFEGDIGIVTFEQCASAKMGMPNDEAFGGHPLAGAGIHVYGAFRVLNSPWIEELARINSVHPRNRPEYWASLNHFIFSFHDSTFECVAESFHLKTCRTTMAAALAEACKNMER